MRKDPTIDHSRCGYVNHTGFDPERLDELHTALFEFVKRTGSYINDLCAVDEGDPRAHGADHVLEDFVKTAHEFEVER